MKIGVFGLITAMDSFAHCSVDGCKTDDELVVPAVRKSECYIKVNGI